MDRWLRDVCSAFGVSLMLPACHDGSADAESSADAAATAATSESVGEAASGSAAESDADVGSADSASGDPGSGTTSSDPQDDTSSNSPSSSSTQAEPGACEVPMASGSQTESIDVDGVERTYLVIVPPSLDGGTSPAPVVMGFHGGNGTAEYASEAYGLTGEEPALYVYPQAPYWEEAGGVAWNVDPDGVDFPYFDAMLDDLEQKYCVDPDRIFAAGQSNGAFFVNELGCRRPDVLRAIAPVAGGGPLSYADCTGTMTVLIVHGIADGTVPVQQGVDAREFWMAQNGCTGAESMPTDPAPCIAYVGCDEAVLWCEHEGGHDWPAFAGPAIREFFLSL